MLKIFNICIQNNLHKIGANIYSKLQVAHLLCKTLGHCVDGWMEGWMEGWMDGWKDEW